MTERTISITGVDEGKASAAASGLDRTAYAIAPEAIPSFTEYNHPEFRARYAVINEDIVVHFFLPEAAGDLAAADSATKQKWNKYWLEVIPSTLSPVAKQQFMADFPQVVAKYTEEEVSWWFCARGFGTTMSPAALVEGFLDKMAESLALPS